MYKDKMQKILACGAVVCGAVIGAGSVATRKIPAGRLSVGRPITKADRRRNLF